MGIFIVLLEGYLRGVEICGETVLEVVGDKPQKLEWPGYGFYIEVPEGALLPWVTASVGVKVILGGQFQLPKNRKLISAIYWVSSSELFLKEVAVNIQHCAVITSEEQCSEFKFVIAKCSQEKLPYKFKEKQGLFNQHTRYAAIKLKQFSLIGGDGPKNTELRYLGLTLYKPIGSRCVNVSFIFVVIHNLEPHLKVLNTHTYMYTLCFIYIYSLCLIVQSIKEEYPEYYEEKSTSSQGIVFEQDQISLNLPLTVNEWKLELLKSQRVLLQVII